MFPGKLVCGKNRVCYLEEDQYKEDQYLDSTRSEIQLRTETFPESSLRVLTISGETLKDDARMPLLSAPSVVLGVGIVTELHAFSFTV